MDAAEAEEEETPARREQPGASNPPIDKAGSIFAISLWISVLKGHMADDC